MRVERRVSGESLGEEERRVLVAEWKRVDSSASKASGM